MRILRKALKIAAVLLVALTVWSVIRAGSPVTAFRREIVVNVPPQVAWDYFSRPKQWVSWLGESASPTEVGPSDEIQPDTFAKFGAFEFRMTTFAPYEHWMWSGKAGWMTIDYDHRFEPINGRQTRMVFHQTVSGFGNSVMATLIGAGTAMAGHQAALQKLADEINRLPAAAQ